MSNDKYQRYANATRANLTPEQLQKARDNSAVAQRKYPEDHARSEALIQEKGLAGHRALHDWYARNKTPIPSQQLNAIERYAESTYAGPGNRGVAREASSTSGDGKLADIYRPAVKANPEQQPQASAMRLKGGSALQPGQGSLDSKGGKVKLLGGLK